MSAVATPASSLSPSAPGPIEPGTRLQDIVFPEHSNHHGTLFGGAALAMLDKLAFILASRSLRRSFVTAAVSRLDFIASIQAGDLADAVGHVVSRGNRSLEIEAELFAENLRTGERTRCLSGRLVMVATGEATSHPTSAEIDDEPDLTRTAEIVFPSHANHSGILHGGPALSWLAKAALVAASRRARCGLVMASSEKLDFIAPTCVGDIADIGARVERVGRSSLTVATTLHAESPLTGERRLCAQAGFVFVAIDDAGRPTPIDVGAPS